MNSNFSQFPPPPLNTAYLRTAQVDAYVKTHKERIMAMIQYNATTPLPPPSSPHVLVALRQLNEQPMIEVWTSPFKVRHLNNDKIWFSLNDYMAFGYASFPELDRVSLEETTYYAYMKALHCSKALGYPHMLRMWNYFPRINEEQQGLERYKRFCLGRYEVFLEHANNDPSAAPAGTAIGTITGPLQVLFLSAKFPGKNFENPRQVRTRDYPPTYGPRSPSFSRATLYRTKSQAQLFIAGTASIVGHASCHFGNPECQVKETLNNIEALIQSVEKEEQLGKPSNPTQRLLKIYVRHPSHRSGIEAQLKKMMPGNLDLLFLVGDICRTELLLEIEGILTYEY